MKSLLAVVYAVRVTLLCSEEGNAFGLLVVVVVMIINAC